MRISKIPILLSFLVILALASQAAQAATFTVNDLGDGSDASAGDGNCATSGAVCTLRAAIEEANSAAGADTINFSVSGTIEAAAPYALTSNGGITVDGGAGHDVVVNGTGITGINCFSVTTANNAIKGLVIQNCNYGIAISGASATGNKIQNNYLGTDATGNAISSSGNARSVNIASTSSGNTVGTDGDGSNDSSEGNVITSGTANGIAVSLEGGSNVVAGNRIGVGADGTTDLGVGSAGINATGDGNVIGFDGTGTASDERNVIAGWNEDVSSFAIFLSSAESNRIAGNYICTAADGTTLLACQIGIQLDSASNTNTIGTNGDGTGDSDEGNIITSGVMTGSAILINASNSNTVAGNRIGVGADGTTDISGSVTGSAGIRLQDADNNMVGFDGTGTAAHERNVIVGFGESNAIGIQITTGSATGNRIAGNYLGVLPDGTTALGNQASVQVTASAGINTIGTNGDGTGDASEGNVIATVAAGTAVSISANSNVIAGNRIGIGADGTADVGAGTYGLFISGGSNVVGYDGTGTASDERNIISCFDEDATSYGIGISGDNNRVSGNYLGVKSNGTTACGSGYGLLLNGADNTVIGTNGDGSGDADEGNVIVSIAAGYGIRIAMGTGNKIAGNMIGVGADGTTDLGAGEFGIYIADASNIIGFDGTGTAAHERNIISGFNEDASSFGIQIINAGGNRVAGNYIGTRSNGTVALANSVGIYVTGASSTSNIIGTNGDGSGDSDEGNVIAGSGTVGVELGSSSSGTVVAGNKIGVGSDGSTDLGNGTHGIYVNNVASNTIGGDTADEENLIRFNGDAASEYGIYVNGASAASNLILRNRVYDNQSDWNVSSNATSAPSISQISGGSITITSTAGYSLQVFRDTDGDSNCEATNYLGTATDNGDGTFSYAAAGLAAGDKIAVTAKTGTSNTSNLSACLDIVTIAFAAASSNGAESTTTVNLSVTTSATVSADTTVSYAVTGGTATGSGGDYTLASGTATVSNGASSTNITITIVNDNKDEPNQTIEVTLSGPSRAALGTNTVHTYTINDDDNAPTISVADNTYAETDANAASTFTVSLSAASENAITVDYATEAGTAGAGTDYTTASGTLTFSADETSKSVNVTVAGDTLDEDDETFNLNLTNPSNATVADSQGVMTIQDNDAAPTVTLSLSGSPLNENGGVGTYTATLSAASGKTVTVNLGFSGTATLTDDYTRSGTSITVNAGATTGTATVTGADDSLDEDDETVIVDISSVTNGTESGTQQQTATIADDDASPGVTLSVVDSPAAENGGVITYTATLSAASGRTVTVNLSYSGTATLTSDYARSGTSITISAGDTTGSVTATSAHDTLDEDDETVIVDIASVTNGTETGTQQQTGTISDDDAAPSVTLSVSGSPVAENGGVATFTATLSAASGRNVTVNLSYSGMASGGGADYTASSSSITINSGLTTGTATATAVSDSIDEADETVIVDISSVTNGTESGTQQQTATITDDDTAGVTVAHSGGSTQVTEGGATDTYTLVLTSQPSADVTLTLTTGTQLSADLTVVTFTNGNWNQTQTITVTAVNDAVAEGLQTPSITHASASADSGYNGLSVASLSVSVTDNDTASVSIAESAGATTLTEGGATDTYSLVLTSQPSSDVTLTLNPGSQSTLSTTTVTFTSGDWNTPQTVTVTAVNDLVAEGNHSQAVSHTAASADSNYSGIAIVSVTAQITDNDAAGVSVTASGGSTSVSAGGETDDYTLVLTSEPAANVTIAVTAGARLSADPASVVFTSVNWNVPQTVTLTAVNADSAAVTVTHAASSADSAYNGISIAGLSVTIGEGEGDEDEGEPVAANAGVDLSIVAGSSVSLSGSASTGSGLSFSWAVVSGGGSLANAESAAPTYTAPSETAEVEIRLTVSADGQSDTDSLTIHVLTASEVDREELTTPMVGFATGAIYETRDASGPLLRTAGVRIRAPEEDYTFAVTGGNYLAISSPSLDGHGKVFLSRVPLSQMSGLIDVVEESASASLSAGSVSVPDAGVSLSVSASERFTAISGTQDGDRFGEYLAAGDVNCDGADEILVGAPGFGHYGAVFVFDADGVAISVVLGSPERELSSVTAAEFLGVCDSDILFGPDNPALNAPLRVHDTLSESDRVSYASLLAGNAGFAGTIDLSQDPVDYSIGDGIEGGVVSQAIGDMNGDGQNDLVLATSEGLALIYLGGGSYNSVLADTEADVVISGAGASEGFGGMMAIGDVTGDGINDLVLGAPEYGSGQTGAVYVVFGSLNPDASIDLASSPNVLRLEGGSAGDRIGSDLLLADADGDGQDEIYTVKSDGTTTRFALRAATDAADGWLLGGSGCSLQGRQGSSPAEFAWPALWILALLPLRIWRVRAP